MNLKKNAITLAAAAALTLSAGASWGQAGKGNPNGFVLSAGSTGISAAQIDALEGLPPPTAAVVTLETPQGNVQSFGLEGDPDNCTITLGDIPPGTEVTGASWDVRIETIGGSWLNEVVFQFRSSDPNDPLLQLTPSATAAAGAEDRSSGGVLLFSAVPLPNIPIGADGELRIEIVDTFDDNAGAADADLFNLPVGGPFGLTFACDNQAACDAATVTGAGSCAGFEFGGGGNGGPNPPPETTPVPVNNPWALALLALILAGLGFVAVRRLA